MESSALMIKEELRGKKFRYLRKKWGFTQASLAEDEHWKKCVRKVQGLATDNAISIKENAGRGNHKGLSDEQLSAIAEAFRVPYQIMVDVTAFEDFVKKADAVHNEHLMYCDSVGLSRNKVKYENDNVDDIKRFCAKWKESGYLYYSIENDAKKITNFTVAHYPLSPTLFDDLELTFILLVSLHFNAGWEKWTIINKTNSTAIHYLISTLKTGYDRVSYRIYYALQFFNQTSISKYIADIGVLDEEVRGIIVEYVFTNRVVEYIKLRSFDKNQLIATKAMAVLAEISGRWKDKSALLN